MKLLLTLVASMVLATSSSALAEGDVAKGEKEFKKCKACHAIKNGDEVIVKGGKTGPDLFGVIGRAAGAADFKFSGSMIAAGESGLVWDEESLAAFITDPKAYLQEVTGDSSAKSKMTFKARKNQEDLAAFLATFSPPPEDSDGAATESNDS